MKCKTCGFKGWGEVGDFGINPKRLRIEHLRCPKCKTGEIEYYEAIDEIRIALRFPRECHSPTHLYKPTKQVVQFIMGGANKEMVGYSIHCPACHWGSGSGISRADYDKLLAENKALVTVDAATELRKLGFR